MAMQKDKEESLLENGCKWIIDSKIGKSTARKQAAMIDLQLVNKSDYWMRLFSPFLFPSVPKHTDTNQLSLSLFLSSSVFCLQPFFFLHTHTLA